MSLLLSLASAEGKQSVSIETQRIDIHELSRFCDSIEGEYPVSIQAAVEFELAGESGRSIRSAPLTKSIQSFECGKERATIYWYEFAADVDVSAVVEDLKAVIWGEPRPSKMHPERILAIDRVVAVISAKQPKYFEWIISHRKTFPDMDVGRLNAYKAQLKCSSQQPKSPAVCENLQLFLDGGPPPVSSFDRGIYLGEYWEVSAGGTPKRAGIEMLYLGDHPQGRSGAFSTIAPDNRDEQEQIDSFLKAQRAGAAPDMSSDLVEYINGSLGLSRAPLVDTGMSIAFIGQGNRVYVRQAPKGLVLLTDSGSDKKKRPFVIAIFPTSNP